MLRKLIGTIAVAAVMAAPAAAQVSVGYTDIGAVVGIGNVGNASASFGGRFEHIFKALPDLGNGLLGIGVSADYYGYSDNFSGFGYSFKYIPIGVTGNYHFKLENKKIDPFLGAGLGYNYISCSYTGIGYSSNYCSSSAIYFIGRAGARYFFNPNMALYGDVGAGAATLNIGLTFKLK
jgi:outer membrane protein W